MNWVLHTNKMQSVWSLHAHTVYLMLLWYATVWLEIVYFAHFCVPSALLLNIIPSEPQRNKCRLKIFVNSMFVSTWLWLFIFWHIIQKVSSKKAWVYTVSFLKNLNSWLTLLQSKVAGHLRQATTHWVGLITRLCTPKKHEVQTSVSIMNLWCHVLITRKITSWVAVRGEGSVAGEGRIFGVAKFHSWGKCTSH